MKPGRPLSVQTIVIGGVLVSLVGTAAIVALLYFYGGGTDRDRAGLDVVRTAGTLVVGTGGAIALLLAARRQRSTELTLEHQRRVAVAAERDAVEQRITELYTHAVDQLGNEKAPVRLGGLHALERLAQNNPDQRQTIVDVICAYLRMPYTPPGSQPPAEDAPAEVHTRYEERRQELQVRMTAERILVAHLRPRVAYYFWAEIDLDLSEAHLYRINLTNCHIWNAQFGGAQFSGDAQFGGAQFSGDALFGGAQFDGVAWFGGAQFGGDAGFEGAQFGGPAVFDEARFRGDTDFEGAQFGGPAVFGEAQFGGDADFGEAWFRGDAGFKVAHFDRPAVFRAARFCGDVDFEGAQFGGDMSFGETQFDGHAWFSKAQFGGNGDFEGVQFGWDMSFEEAQFNGHAWFSKAQFERYAGFEGAQFGGDAGFEGAQFGGDAGFEGAQFGGDAGFEGARARPRIRHLWPGAWTTRDARTAEGEAEGWMYLRCVDDSTE